MAKGKQVQRGMSVVVYTMDGSRLDSQLVREVEQAVQSVVTKREGTAQNKNGNVSLQVVVE